MFACECLCLREGEKQQRERQTNTERAKRVKDTEKETVQGIEAITREHTQEKRKRRKRELPVLPSRRSSPQNARQRTEQNRTYAPLLFFLARSPASRLTSPVFLDVRMRTGKANKRAKRQFLSRSLSLLSISHFTLSLTAQRRPTVLVVQ